MFLAVAVLTTGRSEITFVQQAFDANVISSLVSMLQSSIADQPLLARRMIGGAFGDMASRLRRPVCITMSQFESIAASLAATPPVIFGSGVSNEQVLYILYKMLGKFAAREILQLVSLAGNRVGNPQIIVNLVSFVHIGALFLIYFSFIVLFIYLII